MFIGTMVNTLYGVAELLKEFQLALSIGIAVIRYPLYCSPNLNSYQFRATINTELDELDAVLPFAQQNGMGIIIDMHQVPAGACSNPQVQEELAQFWADIAARFDGWPAVWGFDLMNEPHCTSNQWSVLSVKLAAAIRSRSAKTIFVMHRFDDPSRMSELRPLPFANVVYGFHFYLPKVTTFQGVDGTPTGARYSKSVSWMRKQLAAVEKFRKRYGVRIANTEFGCSRMSGWPRYDNQTAWMRDAVEAFRAVGAEIAIYNGVSDLPFDVWTPLGNGSAEQVLTGG